MRHRVTRNFSETGFTKVFLFMKKFKKSAAGPAAVYRLSGGVNSKISNGTDVSNVVFVLPTTIKNKLQ